MKTIIWRNDDIGAETDLEALKDVHDQLVAAGQIHTVALITKNFHKNRKVIDYIKEHLKEFSIQVHCHSHDKPLTELTPKQLTDDLEKAVSFVIKYFGTEPHTLFPPWNKSDDNVVSAAHELQLDVSTEKVSLSQFIRVAGDIGEDVVNFHSWSMEERVLLSQALALLN